MSKKIVTKSYGTSWFAVILLGIIVGLIGALITHQPLTGFLAGFLLVVVTDFILLASLIPFVGIYLYWIWSIAFYQWFLGLVFGVGTANYANMLALTLIPIIVFAIFGVILCIVTSVVVSALLLALIGAICG